MTEIRHNHVWSSAVIGALLAAAALPSRPAQAQNDTRAEMRQLRALVQQQSAAMQAQAASLRALQSRLAGLEARQSAVTAHMSPPKENVTQEQSALRLAETGTPDVSTVRHPRAPGRAAQPVPAVAAAPPAAPGAASLAGGGGAAAPAGGTPGSVEPRATQDTGPTGSVEGNPPFPVLSGNDRLQVAVSGQVNRELLFQQDGSGRVGTYFADNNVSSTRIRALASGRLDNDTIAVSALEFDLRSNSSVSVTRQNSNNNGGDTPTLGTFRIRRAEVGVQSAAWGSLLLGRGSTFADGIAQFDLSDAGNAFYSGLYDSGGALQLANRGKPYRRSSDPTIAQISDDFDGFRDDRLRYDSPAWHGLQVGGSVAQGLYYDLGVRYAAEISGVKVAGGVSFMDSSGASPSSRKEDGDAVLYTPFARRVAGSFAVLLPNGLNALVSAGLGQHAGGCCIGGATVRQDSTTYYLKGGYQASLFRFGKTNLAADFGQTYNRYQEGDVATRFGVQINQTIIAKGVEVYGGWEQIQLRRTGERFQPTNLGLVGTRVQF